MNTTIKRKLMDDAKDYAAVSLGGVTANNPEKYKAFRNGQDNAIETIKGEMYLNMQYYYEYVRVNEYVTPQDWIENHKHF